MRVDGRDPDEIRPLVINTDFTSFAEGSVLFTTGNTKILCNVSIEDSVPHWMEVEKKAGGWITAEYAMLPRSTHRRRPREIYRVGGRTQEIRRLIGRSLRAAVDLESLGRRTFIIDCDVIQADGGTRTASITGGYIAMVIALSRLIQEDAISREVIKNLISAVSVGIVDGTPLLDLCYEEDVNAQVDANIVMDDEGNFIEIQSTAERKAYSQDQLNELLELAIKGNSELINIQKSIIEECIGTGFLPVKQ